MAFTKSPEYNTHQIIRIPVQGGQWLKSAQTDVQYFNCVPVRIPQFGTDPKHIVIKRPPITNLTSTYVNLAAPSTIIRGSWVSPSNDVWIVDSLGKVWKNGVNVITLGFVGTAVHFVYYVVGDDIRVLLFTGTNINRLYHLTEAGNGVVEPDHAVDPVVSSAPPVFLDGYIFYIGHGFGTTPRQRIYNSTLGDPTEVDISTSFIDAEMHSDALVAITKHHNHIVAFGQRSIEFFYNAEIEIGSPLQRQPAYSSRIGLSTLSASLYRKVMEIGDEIYFIGREEGGGIGVFVIDNFRVKRISFPGLDYQLNLPRIDSSNGVANRMMSMIINGVTCPVVQISTTVGVITTTLHYGFHPIEKEWFQVSLPATEGSVTSDLWRECWNTGEYTYLVGDRAVSRLGINPNNVTAYTAVYSSPLYDFGSDSQKHMKWVDVIGDMGNSAITLAYTDESNHGAFVTLDTKLPGTIGKSNPLRWRNLGRARRQGYKVIVSGHEQMSLEGIEVAYNLGQH
jgi:hypothetical protein